MKTETYISGMGRCNSLVTQLKPCMSFHPVSTRHTAHFTMMVVLQGRCTQPTYKIPQPSPYSTREHTQLRQTQAILEQIRYCLYQRLGWCYEGKRQHKCSRTTLQSMYSTHCCFLTYKDPAAIGSQLSLADLLSGLTQQQKLVTSQHAPHWHKIQHTSQICNAMPWSHPNGCRGCS